MSRKMIDYNINEEGYIDKIDGKQLKGITDTGGVKTQTIYLAGKSIAGRTWEALTPVTVNTTFSYPTGITADNVNFMIPNRYCVTTTVDGITFIAFTTLVSKNTATQFIYSLTILPLASGTTGNLTDVFAAVTAILN